MDGAAAHAPALQSRHCALLPIRAVRARASLTPLTPLRRSLQPVKRRCTRRCAPTATTGRAFTVQERLPLLCVHGLLHLVGYDHESDDDYEAMVAREEGVLAALDLAPEKP
jgi:Endoribonuclease YbeY